MYIFTFILLVISSVLLVDARSSTGGSVLVLVDPSKRDDYSIFFDGLKGTCGFFGLV
jgi:oligosaccharyltransferase complex subunit beta